MATSKHLITNALTAASALLLTQPVWANTTFLEAQTIGSETDTTLHILPADLDGDGSIDIVAGNSIGPSRMYFNDGSGNFSVASATIDDEVVMEVADFDSDGYPDLLSKSNDGTNIHINNGSKGFSTTIPVTSDGQFIECLRVVDIENDGDMDILACHRFEENILYRNDGNNVFTPVTVSDVSAWTFSMVVADLDSDGDADIITANTIGADLVYLNQGDGTFDTGQTLKDANGDDSDDEVQTITFGIASADIDGDGDLDFVTGRQTSTNFASTGSASYINDGKGNFSLKQELTDSLAQNGQISGLYHNIALSDIDNDGDVDLVVAFNGSPNQLLINDGTGNFSDGTDISTDADETLCINTADVDGDGYQDVLVGLEGANKAYVNATEPASETNESNDTGTGLFYGLFAALLLPIGFRKRR